MTADLSTYITDPFVGVLNIDDLRGLSLPTLTAGGFHGVVSSDGLATQAQWSYHETLRTDREVRRTDTLQMQGETNIIRDAVRKAQQCADTMHKIIHGIYGFSEQDRVNATNRFFWKVAGATASTITLQRRSTDADPNAITMSVVSLNPNWEIGVNERTITSESVIKLPANGLIRVASPSKLQYHAGWIIDRISCPTSVGIGDTFTVHLKTPCGAALAQKHDSADPTDILAYIEFYVSGWGPPWVNFQDESQLFCEPTVKDIALPATQNFTLESMARIRIPSNDQFWFRAFVKHVGSSTWFDLSATAIAQVQVLHQPSNSYLSRCDLTGVDLSAFETIRFIYWKESTNAAAQPVGRSRCLHMNRDYSGSVYDSTVSDGGSWNCTNPAGCDATPRVECYDSEASGYTEGTIPSTLDQAAWKQLMNEFYLYERQAMEGFTGSEVIRGGCPSLAELAGLNVSLPSGYHPTTAAINAGGMNAIDLSGDTIVVRQSWEQDWGEINTYGPAGNHIIRTEDIGVGSPGFLTRSMATGATPDFDPYNFAVIGRHGKFQSVKTLIRMAFPRVQTSAAVQEKNGIVLTIGFWDANRNELPDATGAVYFWKIDLPQNQSRYDRKSRSNTWGENIKTMTVHAITDNADGTFTIEPRNGTVRAGTITAPKIETQTQWTAGGTNVATDNHAQRVNNYLNVPYMYRGALRDFTAWPGCVVILSDDLFPANIKGKKFWITGTRAHAGSAQSWVPGSTLTWQIRQSEYSRIAFGNPAERVKSIYVSRNSDTIVLTGGYGFPFPDDLAKDTFAYYDVLNSSGGRELLFKFSRHNMTGIAADQVIYMEVETELFGGDGSQYDFTAYSNIDLVTETVSPKGINTAEICNFTINSPSTITALSIVSTRINPNGTGFIEETLTQVPLTASFSLLERDQFVVIEVNPTEWVVLISPDLVGASLQIQVTNSSAFSGTEQEYYDGHIAIHGASLPTMLINGGTYEDEGNKGDEMDVVDEGGIIDSIKATIAGKTITVATSGVAQYTDVTFAPQVKILNGETITDLTEATDYDYFGASGEIWGKVEVEAEEGTTIVDGDSILLGMYMADRSSLPKSNLTAAVRMTIEDMVSK